MSEAQAIKTKNTKNKIILFFLIGLPLLTVTLSTAMFKLGIGIPKNTTNIGTLVVPPKQIVHLNLSRSDGSSFKYVGSNQWSFILPESQNCTQECKERLYLTRQVHVSLGKNAHSLRRLFLNTGSQMNDLSLDFIKREHPKLEVIHVNGDEWASFSQDFATDTAGKRPYYLVDPAGFVMMKYTSDNDYKDLLKDLKALIAKVGGH